MHLAPARSARTRAILRALCSGLAVTALVLGQSQPAQALGEGRQGAEEARRPINFVSVCQYSHSAHDDPIVYPGRPDAAHLHDFFGNTSTDAHSTYASLRASRSTCQIDGDTAAYWTPALYDSGKRVKPIRAHVYYLPGTKNHRDIQAFPAGLRLLAKDDRVVSRFYCTQGRSEGEKSRSVPSCPSNSHLVMVLTFPDCWDGENLDSPDHSSHMTFAVEQSCPQSHPVPVPLLNVYIRYPTDGGDVTFGSHHHSVEPHADFFNAWDQPTLQRLVLTCLTLGHNCEQSPPLT